MDHIWASGDRVTPRCGELCLRSGVARQRPTFGPRVALAALSAVAAGLLAACAPPASTPPTVPSAAPSEASREPASPAALVPTQADYANVDGLRLYYEVYGSGKPLVLLHGGLCTIEACFGPLIPVLAPGRQLIPIRNSLRYSCTR